MMSRCVVGSSMSRKFGGLISSFTSAKRDFSPPESTETFLWTSSLRKRNVPSMPRACCSVRPFSVVRSSITFSRTVSFGLRLSTRFWAK